MSEKITIETYQDPFTPVPNYIINDPTMLLETRMTWIYLFSKRNIPGWIVRPYDIQKALGFKDFVWRQVSKQLKELGYLIEFHTADGKQLRFVWDWDLKKHKFKPPLEVVDKEVDNQGIKG